MTILIAGLILFFAVHSVPSFVRLRRRLIVWKGPKVYALLYSLVSGTGFVLIVYGKYAAPHMDVFDPQPWAFYAAPVIMWFALIILPAAYLPSNVKRVVRHPFLWGVFLWSIAHLLVNGDLASVILFGAFGVFALIDMWSFNRRGAKLTDQQFPRRQDALLVAVGTAAFLWLVYIHEPLFGVGAISF